MSSVVLWTINIPIKHIPHDASIILSETFIWNTSYILHEIRWYSAGILRKMFLLMPDVSRDVLLKNATNAWLYMWNVMTNKNPEKNFKSAMSWQPSIYFPCLGKP